MEKNKSGVSAIPAPSSAQAGRDSATEVDPYNLLGKKGVLGFKPKTKDFGPKTSKKLIISILKFAGILGTMVIFLAMFLS